MLDIIDIMIPCPWPVSLHTVNLSTLVNAAVVVGVEEDETVIVMFLRQENWDEKLN